MTDIARRILLSMNVPVKGKILAIVSSCISITNYVCVFGRIYSVSQKNPPHGFLKFFPKRLGVFNQFFTHLLYYHFYTRLQIFIQISPTLTKLSHTKRDHLTNFYISLELKLLSLLTEQMTSLLTSRHIPHVC